MFSPAAKICSSISALKTCHSGVKSVGSLRDQSPSKNSLSPAQRRRERSRQLVISKREGRGVKHSQNLAEAHCVRLQMLRIIFEGIKVHINDKTSQSSEESKDRKQSSTESSMLRGLVMLDYKIT